ncbi:hypothetical protein ACOSQ3_024927 [Xanthoceras sorbifolium]
MGVIIPNHKLRQPVKVGDTGSASVRQRLRPEILVRRRIQVKHSRSVADGLRKTGSATILLREDRIGNESDEEQSIGVESGEAQQIDGGCAERRPDRLRFC